MIGAVADDFTGGTDVAVALRRAGLRTVVLFGQPDDHLVLPDADAVVIALKSRTIAPSDAVSQSITAVRWLRANGATQFFFKYCSTFDSTPRGNIGPVSDAIARELGVTTTVMTPSSPEHGRTQYMGNLYVGDLLLSESPMRHHPLTPMTDSFIPRVLESQTEKSVALIDHRIISRGTDAISARLAELREARTGYVVVDAVSDQELRDIGAAIIDDVFVAGAAGLAGGIASARVARDGAEVEFAELVSDPVGDVPSVALAGSCSARTLEQISVMQQTHPSFLLDAVAIPDSVELTTAALDWFDRQPDGSAPLIYSSLPPEQLRETQKALGAGRASELLETAMGFIARGLVERGVRRIVVAGGETSGAVVSALDVQGGLIGSEVAPGVPWIYTTGENPTALLLKSGNFGEPELLAHSVEAGRPAGVTS